MMTGLLLADGQATRRAPSASPRRALIPLLAALLSVACGEPQPTLPPGPPSTAAAAGTGSVGIFITDAPSDEFDEILVTIDAIQLLGNGDPVDVFTGRETIDLKDLESFSDLFVYAEEVRTGSYAKIRLIVSRVLLGREGAGGVERVEATLPASGKLDLVPRGPFSVRRGITLVIELDMDARRAVQAVEGGDRFVFRPVVLVTIQETRSPSKLGRAHGVVSEIFDGSSFELCSSFFMASRELAGAPESVPEGGIGDRHRCMTVETGAATGVFDSNGDPTSLGTLGVGAEITVVGRFHLVGASYDGVAWPRSTASEPVHDHHPHRMGPSAFASVGRGPVDASEELDDDALDDDRPVPPRPQIVLVASVIEIGPVGTFFTLAGMVESELDQEDVFDFAIAPGQGFGESSLVKALVQRGTRIFSRRGEPLGEEEIIPGTGATIDGVFSASLGESLYKTALLILDLEDPIVDVLRGTIVEIDDGARRLVLETRGGGRGEECVDVPEDARILAITFAADLEISREIELEALDEGDRVDAWGGFEEGEACFTADTVIAYPEEEVACAGNADCGPGRYCATEPGACNAEGSCRPMPQLCLHIYDPVCGCDGNTYESACDAAAKGIVVGHRGACELSQSEGS